MTSKKIVLPQKKIKDPVTVDRIHKQSLAQEKKSYGIFQDFKVNVPQKMQLYADKPHLNKFLLMKLQDAGKTLNGVDINQKLNDQLKSSRLSDYNLTRISGRNQIPRNKSNYPRTSNQQFGWYVVNQQDPNSNSKFKYPRKICFETYFADDYYTMRRYSLYSNKNKI